MDDHTAGAAHPRLDHADRPRRGYRSVDGVAAAPEHLDAGLGSAPMTGRDHAGVGDNLVLGQAPPRRPLPCVIDHQRLPRTSYVLPNRFVTNSRAVSAERSEDTATALPGQAVCSI